MSRFDRVLKLAYECFKYKTYLGLRVEKNENYLGVITCKCGEICTEVFYNPKEKTAKIMTFDYKHKEESRLSKLLSKIGIKSNIEVCDRVDTSNNLGFTNLGLIGMARSPSGKVDDEQFELMGDLYDFDGL